MILSKIICEAGLISDTVIQNEKKFETLAIIENNLNVDYCTYIDSEKYIDRINRNTKMIITTLEISNNLIAHKGYGLCITKNPKYIFLKLHNFLSDNKKYMRKSFQTKIGSNCEISSNAFISQDNVNIGSNVIIEDFASVYANVEIGDNTIIRSGAKIGGEGFRFLQFNNGVLSVKHLGGVVIKNNCEIQYNSTIDKAVYPWDNTIIGSYNKIDNLVHIGHGVKSGNNVLFAANSLIGGKTIIGDNSWIGLGACISNGLSIGKNSRANMGSVVTKSIPDNSSFSGNFAIKHSKFIKHIKAIDKKYSD